MTHIEAYIWLALLLVITERLYAGRPTRYTVNPRVHELFADAGETLKKRRAAIREVFA